MRIRDIQARVSEAAPDLKHFILGLLALLIFFPAYAQSPAEAAPEEGNLLGVILFFIVFVGKNVGGGAYYLWRAKEKPRGADDEKKD